MTIMAATGTRRSFLRLLTSAALTTVTMGAKALLGPVPASAQGGAFCCLLIATVTPWCPLLCAEQVGWHIRCWNCNGFKCKCCECVSRESCFAHATCSYAVGCCYYDD